MTTGKRCNKHGGVDEFDQQSSYFMCDLCARGNLGPCDKCGGPVRSFGEAAMVAIFCEDLNCDNSFSFIGYCRQNGLQDAWHDGLRGLYIDEALPDNKFYANTPALPEKYLK